MSPPRIMVVSASDTRFMPYLDAMLTSLAPTLARPNVSLACLDLGLTEADRARLAGHGAALAVPRGHLGVGDDEHSAMLRSFLARPFLPEYFPGHDVYVWIDSDIWLQDQTAFDAYVDGAMRHGMAVTHERERGYRFQAWLFGWTSKHFLLGYGPAVAAHLLLKRQVNAGFFAIRADAPHWAAWGQRYKAAIARTGSLVPHDQFSLNHALHGDPLGAPGLPGTALLDPGCNWICDRGVPMWNDDAGQFCKPYAPYEPIGVLHLAGPAKRTMYDIRRTGGGSFRTYILHGACPDAPATATPLDAAAVAQAA